MRSTRESGTTADVGALFAAEGDGRVVLNFYYDGGVQVAELAEGPGLIVGRAEPSDVKLPVESLSRRHARFAREGQQIWVEDLGSRNGVQHRSETVRQARLEPGSIVRLGGVTAVVHQLGKSRARSADPWSHDVSDQHAHGFSGEPGIDDSGALPLPVLRSPGMRALEHKTRRVAATDMPVIIVGETGVGKELVAQAIHGASNRKQGVFRAINCGAIPDSLLMSLLFGHEKGAFTGAHQASKGLFEQAQGGTVFLDEIGELSAPTQAALLRVLETKRVTRLGSHSELQLDARVIAATHRDLEAMTQAGTFRSDLLFRLNAFVLSVPPLRERREEIWPLAEHFIRIASSKFGLPIKRADEAAVAALLSYPWPGNVRELRNVVEHALVMSEGAAIRERDLPDRVRTRPGPAVEARGRAPEQNIATVDIAQPPASRTEQPSFEGEGYRDRVRDYEVGMILEGLRMSKGNQTHAAELLKLPLRTLVHKIKLYGIRDGYDAE